MDVWKAAYLQCRHHDYGGNGDIGNGGSGKIWHNPLTEGRVYDVLVDQILHCPRHGSKIDRISSANRLNLQFFLSFMADKLFPQLFRISIHEKVELG